MEQKKQEVARIIPVTPNSRGRVPQSKKWTLQQEDTPLYQLLKQNLSPAQRKEVIALQERLEYLAQKYFIWPDSLFNTSRSPRSNLNTSDDEIELHSTAPSRKGMSPRRFSPRHYSPRRSDVPLSPGTELNKGKSLKTAISGFTLGQALNVCASKSASEQFSYAASLDMIGSLCDGFCAIGLLLPQLRPQFLNVSLLTPAAGSIFLGATLPLGIAIAIWQYYIEEYEDEKHAAMIFYHYLYFNQIHKRIERKQDAKIKNSQKVYQKRLQSYFVLRMSEEPLIKKCHSYECAFVMDAELSAAPSQEFSISSPLPSATTLHQEEPAPGGDVLPESMRRYWKKSLISSIVFGLFSFAAMYGLLWSLGSIDALLFKTILFKISPFLLTNWFIIAVGISLLYGIVTGRVYYNQVKSNFRTQARIQAGFDRIEKHKRILLHKQILLKEYEECERDYAIPRVTADVSTATKGFNFLEKVITTGLGIYFFYWALNAIFPPTILFTPVLAIPIFFISLGIGFIVASATSADEENYPAQCDRLIERNRRERLRYHKLLNKFAQLASDCEIPMPEPLTADSLVADEVTLVEHILQQRKLQDCELEPKFQKKKARYRSIVNEGARVNTKFSDNLLYDKSLSSAVLSGFITFVVIVDFYWCLTEVQGLMLSSLILGTPGGLFIFLSLLAIAAVLSVAIAYHSYQASRIRNAAQMQLYDLHAEHTSLLEKVHTTIKMMRNVIDPALLGESFHRIPRAASLNFHPACQPTAVASLSEPCLSAKITEAAALGPVAHSCSESLLPPPSIADMSRSPRASHSTSSSSYVDTTQALADRANSFSQLEEKEDDAVSLSSSQEQYFGPSLFVSPSSGADKNLRLPSKSPPNHSDNGEENHGTANLPLGDGSVVPTFNAPIPVLARRRSKGSLIVLPPNRQDFTPLQRTPSAPMPSRAVGSSSDLEPS